MIKNKKNKRKTRSPMEFEVSQNFLEMVAHKNSCSSLDMYEQEKSRGQVIEWGGVFWVCVGSTSQYQSYLDAQLHRVVPKEQYQEPPHSYNGNDPDGYYPGGKFRDRKGKWWVITDDEIEFVPLKEMEPT